MSDHEEREYEEQEEAQIEYEEEEAHTPGDLHTMLILSAIVIGAVIHSLLILLFVGKGIAGPDAWNLGWPPTGPFFIPPF